MIYYNIRKQGTTGEPREPGSSSALTPKAGAGNPAEEANPLLHPKVILCFYPTKTPKELQNLMYTCIYIYTHTYTYVYVYIYIYT